MAPQKTAEIHGKKKFGNVTPKKRAAKEVSNTFLRKQGKKKIIIIAKIIVKLV